MEERIIEEHNRLLMLKDRLLWGEISSDEISSEDLKKIREMITEEDRRTRPYEDVAKEVGLREAEKKCSEDSEVKYDC